MVNNAPSSLDLVNLDFDTNKAALIAYLQTQPRFKDYNFLGSDMAVLLDVLGIDFFRNAFFTNMAISEGFIDSAQVASDIRSHAKELGYTPRSATSASANLTVNFTATGDSQPYVIPKGSSFSTFVKSQPFTFSIAEQIIVASPNNNFTFTTDVYEGIYVKDSYIFQSNATPLLFNITNPNIDTSSLVVTTFEDNQTVTKIYNLATSLLDLTSNSLVYFLQCSAINGGYQVLFGDGIFGYQPQNGALVVFDYRLSSGAPANGSAKFSLNFDPTGAGEMTGSPTVITNTVATGGAAEEDIETTRFYAPRWFQVQERCIVPSDYEVVLKQQYPEIQAINAFGGETLSPPQFGKVYIAVDISNVIGLPLSKATQYTSFIKGRMPMSIQPIFIAANNLYIGVNTTVDYNINVTTETAGLISSIVQTAIANFNNANLNDFDVTFYMSQFVTAINAADPSIVTNDTSIYLYQKISPTQDAQNFNLNYGVPLNNSFAYPGNSYSNTITTCLTSTIFQSNGVLSQLADDGLGTVRIVNIQGNTYIVQANVGVISYTSGTVQLTEFAVDSFTGDNLLVQVLPASDDVTVAQNFILSIEPAQTVVNVVQVSQ